MGFAKGIADGMAENAARSAASAAHWARVDANNARRQADDAEVEGFVLARRNEALRDEVVSFKCMASAAVAVLHGFGDLLDSLPESQREALKAALVAHTAPHLKVREDRLEAEGVAEASRPASMLRNSPVSVRLGFGG